MGEGGLIGPNTQEDTHAAGLLHVSTLPLAPLPAVCPLHLSHTEGLMTQQLT